MCKIAVWARRASMRGLKVIAFRYPEISDLLFDQPPFLIDYMILILVSDLIFILLNVVTEKSGVLRRARSMILQAPPGRRRHSVTSVCLRHATPRHATPRGGIGGSTF